MNHGMWPSWKDVQVWNQGLPNPEFIFRAAGSPLLVGRVEPEIGKCEVTQQPVQWTALCAVARPLRRWVIQILIDYRH